MTDDEQLDDAGRAFREEIEVRTDEWERPVIDALGDDLDELVKHLDAWSDAIITAGSTRSESRPSTTPVVDRTSDQD